MSSNYFPDNKQSKPPDSESFNRGQPKKKLPSALTTSGNFLRVLITLGVCVFFAIFVLESASDLFGLKQIEKKFEITIPEGLSIEQLGEALAESKIVDKKSVFIFYANFKKDEIKINPGTYILNSNMAYEEIFTILRTGDIKIA